jgi:WhiB family redox-sensing transcriptional regulator
MILDLDEEWRRDASCGNAPDDWLFFDHAARDRHDAMQQARVICGSCPARAACLEYALNDLSLEGVWAATTHDQRRRMARNRKRETRAKEATA